MLLHIHIEFSLNAFYVMDCYLLVCQLIFHNRIKFADVDYYFICDRVATRTIQFRFISFKNQLAMLSQNFSLFLLLLLFDSNFK